VALKIGKKCSYSACVRALAHTCTRFSSRKDVKGEAQGNCLVCWTAAKEACDRFTSTSNVAVAAFDVRVIQGAILFDENRQNHESPTSGHSRAHAGDIALAGAIMAAPFLFAVFKDLGEVPPMMMQ
jgi:hypothetical protein